MRINPMRSLLRFLLWTGVTAAAVGIGVEHPADAGRASEVIWRDSGAIAALDMIHGSGGVSHAPHPAATFAFTAEDAGATSPKFDVSDAQGVVWKVKLGDEARAETAATRFLWAAGYLV